MTNYLDKLRQSARENSSIVCMGLDPVVDALPDAFNPKTILDFWDFFDTLCFEMQEQKVLPGAFKLNAGCYLQHDRPFEGSFPGSRVLANTISIIRDEFPRTPVILDFKRGDIDRSSANYAVEGFDCWNADAVTVNPYMGTDSVMPFIERAMKDGRGVYILNRTSNKGAADLQDLEVKIGTDGGIKTYADPLYEVVARKIVGWANGHPGVGAVVGATSLEELANLAQVYAGKDVSLLIPGVGKQGGSAGEVMDKLYCAAFDIGLVRINSSSGLTHPWYKKTTNPCHAIDAAKICVAELATLNDEIGYKIAR